MAGFSPESPYHLETPEQQADAQRTLQILAESAPLYARRREIALRLVPILAELEAVQAQIAEANAAATRSMHGRPLNDASQQSLYNAAGIHFPSSVDPQVRGLAGDILTLVARGWLSDNYGFSISYKPGGNAQPMRHRS